MLRFETLRRAGKMNFVLCCNIPFSWWEVRERKEKKTKLPTVEVQEDGWHRDNRRFSSL